MTKSSRKMLTKGSRAQVYHGNALHTSGGLYKKDLLKSKRGRIISRRKHASGMKRRKHFVENVKPLGLNLGGKHVRFSL